MANVKITELTAATALAGTDVLPIVDVGADATKKVSVSDLLRNLPDGTASAPALAFADDQNTGVLSPAANELAFATSGTQRLVIDSSGNVGIGTTNPEAKLDAQGSGTQTIRSRTNDTSGSAVGRVQISYVGGGGGTASNSELRAGDGYSYLVNTTSTPLLFGIGGTERMRINSAGNVGIGTSSPAQKLDVNGSIKASGNASIGATTGNTFIELGAGATENRTAFMDFVGDTTYSDYGFRVQRSAGGANTESQLFHRGTGDFRLIAQEAAPIEFWTSNTERLRIDSSGNLAIGNTSADGRLHVRKDGTGQILQIWQSDLGTNNRNIQLKSPSSDSAVEPFTFATGNSFAVQIDSSEAFRINAAGNVGIGTSSPNAILHTAGTRDYTGTSPGLNSYDNNFVSGTAVVSIGQSNGCPSIQGHGSGTAFNLALAPNAGKVGIGTSSPAQKLHVSGTGFVAAQITGDSTSETQLRFTANTAARITNQANTALLFDTNASERMRIDSSGRLLVGLTSSSASAASVLQGFAGSSTGQGILQLQVGKNNAATANNENLGSLRFANSNGSIGALVSAEADAQWASSDYPSRLTFHTTADNASSPTERMRIDSAGRVGIGTTSPGYPLEIRSSSSDGNFVVGNSSGQALQGGYSTGGAASYIQAWNTVASAFIDLNIYGSTVKFGTGSGATERVRIDSSGRLLVGGSATVNSSGGAYIQLTGGDSENIKTYRIGTGAREHLQFYNGDFNSRSKVGSISTSGSSTAFNTSSDYRLKENVVDLDGAIIRVKQLSPKRFNFIVDADTTVDGFLAHEAATVVPEAVTGTHNEVDDDGNAVMQGIDQSKLVPLLTAALQEAIAKIETLETKVAALEAQ